MTLNQKTWLKDYLRMVLRLNLARPRHSVKKLNLKLLNGPRQLKKQACNQSKPLGLLLATIR